MFSLSLAKCMASCSHHTQRLLLMVDSSLGPFPNPVWPARAQRLSSIYKLQRHLPNHLGTEYLISLLLFPLEFLWKQTRSLNLLVVAKGCQERKAILFQRLQNWLLRMKWEQWSCGCKAERIRGTREKQCLPTLSHTRKDAASLLPFSRPARHHSWFGQSLWVGVHLCCHPPPSSLCFPRSCSLGCLLSLLGTAPFLYINSQPPLCLTIFPMLVFFSLKMSNIGPN